MTADGKESVVRRPLSVVQSGTIRKTSLLRIVPTACGQAADMHWRRAVAARKVMRAVRVRAMLGDCESVATDVAIECSERSYLFTMSDIAQPHEPTGLGGWRKTFLLRTSSPGWWSQTGSNRRPPACKAGALPTELWPRQRTEDGRQRTDRNSAVCRPWSVV
jgi:hypothetical protein